ncbi:hypothetical protein GCM10017600_14200 [Streptosporangium carneum]|uniref:Uncharacterized protein n=1 Tax=Streptosporangium carneum TaxID=47481 RepID=A0A9W6HZ48_9ACTN|nr:hypothetical protein GCM10017600_14200 [Streptosporangium carneum]
MGRLAVAGAALEGRHPAGQVITARPAGGSRPFEGRFRDSEPSARTMALERPNRENNPPFRADGITEKVVDHEPPPTTEAWRPDNSGNPESGSPRALPNVLPI